jgi:flagellin-like protein
MLKNKKSVSALIATILLIVVAVALIAIILTWGKSFTNEI